MVQIPDNKAKGNKNPIRKPEIQEKFLLVSAQLGSSSGRDDTY
jgi:hypothetical protein